MVLSRAAAQVLRARTFLVALALVSIAAGVRHYRAVVPTTWDVAQRRLGRELQPVAGKLIYIERGVGPDGSEEEWARIAGRRGPVELVERIEALPLRRLELADGLVVLAHATWRSSPSLRRRLRGTALSHHAVVAPRWFAVRGETLHLVRTRLVASGEPLAVTLRPCPRGDGCYAGVLPVALAAGEVVTVGAWIPFTILARSDEVPTVVLGDEPEPLPLAWTGRAGRGHRFVSRRVRLAAATSRLGVLAPAPTWPGDRFPLTVQRWR